MSQVKCKTNNNVDDNSGRILSHRFYLVRNLCLKDEQVYAAIDLLSGQQQQHQVAVKIEYKHEDKNRKQMCVERKIYEKLVDAKCVPRIHWYV